MNTRLLIIGAATLLFAACHSESDITLTKDTNNASGAEATVPAPDITAVQETNSPTKSLLEVDGDGVGTIYWTPADEINVFYGSTSTHYVSQNTENATTAVFKTTDVIGTSESASENIWGLYPYNEDATCSGSAVNTTLPATQYGVPGTFDDDLFITLAHNTSTALVFYNVCGGIKFSLSRDDITSITFRGNNNEDIAGDISLNFVDGLPNVSVSSGQKEITLTPKVGNTFVSGENYYLVLLPGVLSAGFTMTFTTSTGTVGTFNYTAKPVTIKRSVFSKKTDIDIYASDFIIPTNQIVYTTSDGNTIDISSIEPAPVSTTYANGIGIITFDSAVTGIGGFRDMTNLTSVSLPNSVRYIYERAFQGCSNLMTISLSDNLETIARFAFLNCENLSSITIPIPDINMYIGQSAFEGCSSLLSVSIPIRTDCDIRVFRGCTSLTSVSLPNDWTSIPEQLLYGCTNLESVTIPNKVKTIYGDAFSGCTNLTTIEIPASVTAIEAGAFEHSGLTSIVIPNKVSRIGMAGFSYCTNLESVTVLPTTPPTAGLYLFYMSSCPIYVPAGSVDTYKAASGWSTFASRIQAIP